MRRREGGQVDLRHVYDRFLDNLMTIVHMVHQATACGFNK